MINPKSEILNTKQILISKSEIQNSFGFGALGFKYYLEFSA